MHYQARRKQFFNVGGYGLQAAHRQRFKRSAVPGQVASARFVGVTVCLAGLNCIH
jgi:hypothetical protein